MKHISKKQSKSSLPISRLAKKVTTYEIETTKKVYKQNRASEGKSKDPVT